MDSPREWISSRCSVYVDAVLYRMCSCQHKVHWSVVSVIVNVVAIVLFTSAVTTPHWAERSGTLPVNTGLFQTCSEVNGTCYDTSMYFDAYKEKDQIIAGAVMNILGLVGMFLFFALAVFFLCGLYGEKQLATGAVITAYVSALFAMIGTIMFAAAMKSISFSLGWSFILAVLGFVVDIAAGVLMCVGRNLSTHASRPRKRPRQDENGNKEQLELRQRFEEKHLPVRPVENKQSRGVNEGADRDVWTSADGQLAESWSPGTHP